LFIKMEGQIVVISISIGSSPKMIIGHSAAMDPRDVRYVRLTKKMYFRGLMKTLGVDESSRYRLLMLPSEGRRGLWIKKQ
jgi:hypothetical protein